MLRRRKQLEVRVSFTLSCPWLTFTFLPSSSALSSPSLVRPHVYISTSRISRILLRSRFSTQLLKIFIARPPSTKLTFESHSSSLWPPDPGDTKQWIHCEVQAMMGLTLPRPRKDESGRWQAPGAHGSNWACVRKFNIWWEAGVGHSVLLVSQPYTSSHRLKPSSPHSDHSTQQSLGTD